MDNIMSGFYITWIIVLFSVLLIAFYTSDDDKLRKVLFWALAVRLMLMVIEVYIYPDLPYLTAADAGRFQRRALAYATLPLPDLLTPPYPGGSGLYSYIMAIFYVLFGTQDDSLIRAINILAGVFTVYNGYHISCMLWTRKIALQNAFILAFFPLLAVYAQNPIREAFVIYFLTLGVMYYISYVKYRRMHHMVLAVLGFAISTALHMAALMALLALVVYHIWLTITSLMEGRILMVISSMVAVLIVGGGLFVLNTTGWGLSNIGGEGAIGEFGVEELIEERGGDRRTGRASYLVGMTASNPADFFWQTPVRAVFFLFTPFPWMLDSIWDLVGLFDALLYLLIFFGIFMSFPYIRKDPAGMAILIMVIGMIIAFAWGVTNYGTGMRHRAKIIPLLICLAPQLYPLRNLVFEKARDNVMVVYLRKWFIP